MTKKIDQAVKVLKEGGIVLYPTEGVYGLGCDPFNETAVLRLLKIKKRDVSKGLILIAASWDQVKDLVKIDLTKRSIIKSNDSVPTTWVFPSTKETPRWITGKFRSIAIRVTKHPEVKKICQKFGGPIVSTSANITKQLAIKKLTQVDKKILNSVDYILLGKIGVLGKPTQICNIRTGKIIRV